MHPPPGTTRPLMDDVPPSGFSASSSSSTARYGCLHFPFGAWVAAGVGEFLEIRLAALSTITAVTTQGHPVEHAWVSAFHLLYSLDCQEWFAYLGGAVMKGSSDPHGLAETTLAPPVTAAALRFVVERWEGKPALRVGVSGAEAPSSSPSSSLQQCFKSLVNSDKDSDVALIVQSGVQQRTLLAHKCILRARSRYFAAALDAADAEQDNPRVTQLVVDNVVPPSRCRSQAEACELSLRIVRAVLVFLYCAETPESELLFAVRRVARQLDLPGLYQTCYDALHQRSISPATCTAAFRLADLEGAEQLKQAALDTIVANWNSLKGLDWDQFTSPQILSIVSAVEKRGPA